jgi:hypothetical protein
LLSKVAFPVFKFIAIIRDISGAQLRGIVAD